MFGSKSNKEVVEKEYEKISWGKGLLFLFLEFLLFVIAVLYFSLKGELNIDVGFIGYSIFIGVFIFLHSKNRKTKISRDKGSNLGFSLMKEKLRENKKKE